MGKGRRLRRERLTPLEQVEVRARALRETRSAHTRAIERLDEQLEGLNDKKKELEA